MGRGTDTSSWCDDAERFRDLDDLVEQPPSRLGGAARWLLVGAAAALAGLAAWHHVGSGRSETLPALGEFDEQLARHTPQRPLASSLADQASPLSGRSADSRRAVQQQTKPPGPVPAAAEAERERGLDVPVDDPTDDADSPLPEQPGGYHIQVASLRSKERAELLVSKLQRDGHQATREAVGRRGRGWWHTVRIGPFDTRIDAEIYRLQFEPFQGLHSVVVPRSDGEYHVRAASLRSRAKAEKLAARLKRKGHHARRRRIRVPGRGERHSVLIGPFDTRAEAEAYRAHFTKLEEKTAVVVPFERLEP